MTQTENKGVIFISATGLFYKISMFSFFGIIGIIALLVGGYIGIHMVKQKPRLLGVIILGGTAWIALISLMTAANVFTDSSVKGADDIELTSTLHYDRVVTIYDVSSSKDTGSTSYVYYLDDGTEIGLTKRQHKYVQEHSDVNAFRIIYYNNPRPKEYDFKFGWGENTRGTPLIEADYVEPIE
ncbi:hypothetical protein ACIQYL_20280 [Lysinibacillus xylanilyticus]|uniref:hypothetical protein n=1 Tax=Lysinibacillus xylanilyticus TaxID=582475 RepID=UPI00381DC88D